MDLSAPAEDCILLVHRLTERSEVVSTSALAHELGVTDSTVTAMVQKLAKLKLLNYRPRKAISLTRLGGALASRLIRRHRLIETYLCTELGYSWDEVHGEAESIEHSVSERFVEAISRKLGHPSFDPHGDPIPSADGVEIERALVPLVSLDVETPAVLARVYEKEPDILVYLAKLGLKPGARVRVVERPAHDSVVRLAVEDKLCMIGKPLARKLFVELTSSKNTKRNRRS